MKFLIFLTVIALQSASSQPSPFGFKVQHIGHQRYVSPEEEQKRNWCENYWCTNDAFYLFTQSSQYVDQDPCVDFKNFSVGKTWEIDVVNYRSQSKGFYQFYYEKFKERLKKILTEKITSNDNRIVRVIKNTFQKCLKTEHQFRHLQGHQDIIKYLNSFGGSPYLTRHVSFNPNRFDASKDFKFDIFPGEIDNSWNGEDLDILKYFEDDPIHAFQVFFNYEFLRCTIADYEGEFLCLALTNHLFDWTEENNLTWISYEESLMALEDSHLIAPQFKKILKEQIIHPALNNLREYQLERKRIYNESNEKHFGPPCSCENPELGRRGVNNFLIPINRLNEVLKLDWIKIINGVLLDESKVNDTSKFIVIQQLDLFLELATNLMNMKKEVIADTFVLTYLQRVIHSVIKNFHNRQAEVEHGYKHAQERWHSCFRLFLFHRGAMKTAYLAYYESKRAQLDSLHKNFNRPSNDSFDVLGEAEKFVKEAVGVAIKSVITGSNFPIRSSIKFLRKLKNLEIVIGVTNKTLKIDELEIFYKDLKLNGTEGLMESLRQMEIFRHQLKNEIRNKWIIKIRDMAVNSVIKYDPSTSNILYIPPDRLIYPFYHPLRPRFFNMATLFKSVINAISDGLDEYMREYEVFKYILALDPSKKTHHANSFLSGIDSAIEISYFHYKKWLETHKDLQIGANYLTNLQLFLVANAVTAYSKYNPSTPKSFEGHGRLSNEYLHVFYKIGNSAIFYDAFKCNVTTEEKEKLKEFKNKFDEWHGTNWRKIIAPQPKSNDLEFA